MIMKPSLVVFAAGLLGICSGAGVSIAQSLPSTVEPGVQRDRLLNRDTVPLRPGPAVLQAIDCGRDQPVSNETFTLKGVHLKTVVPAEKVDTRARWQPYLGEDVTLAEICEIALALAGDYAGETGRALSAVLPVQYIDSGVVQVSILPE